jgi:formamidopyrimidine-DNA glycosylase
MPEIAEVAVYAHDIKKLIKKAVLKKAYYKGEKRWQKTIVPQGVRNLLKEWTGHQLTLSSLGKTLYLESENNENDKRVQFKLGMTGMFQIKKPTPEVLKKHVFLVLEFDFKDGNPFFLYYMDYRRFGRVSVSEDENKQAIAGYSPELGFNTKSVLEIKNIIKKLSGLTTKPRITWLLEHGVKTGVGNYLANEALGKLNLSPFSPFASEKEAVKTLITVCRIARQSYRYGGNSFKGGYYRLTGERGEFFRFCKFYRNFDINCYKFNGRSVYTNFVLKLK